VAGAGFFPFVPWPASEAAGEEEEEGEDEERGERDEEEKEGYDGEGRRRFQISLWAGQVS
jgi:hypothetical protein